MMVLRGRGSFGPKRKVKIDGHLSYPDSGMGRQKSVTHRHVSALAVVSLGRVNSFFGPAYSLMQMGIIKGSAGT